MRLENEVLRNHRPEIESLYQEFLGESSKGHTLFGLFGEDEELRAVASLRNIGGNWRLRGCVVKEKYRGKGYQQALIQERVDFLRSIGVEIVRVCVFPDNEYSINNIVSAGFYLVGATKIGGQEANLYELNIPIEDLK